MRGARGETIRCGSRTAVYKLGEHRCAVSLSPFLLILLAGPRLLVQPGESGLRSLSAHHNQPRGCPAQGQGGRLPPARGLSRASKLEHSGLGLHSKHSSRTFTISISHLTRGPMLCRSKRSSLPGSTTSRSAGCCATRQLPAHAPTHPRRSLAEAASEASALRRLRLQGYVSSAYSPSFMPQTR